MSKNLNNCHYIYLPLILFIFFISGCGDTPGTPDTKKPSVTSKSPSSGATGAAVNTTVSASFSEGVYFDSFTLTSQSSVSRSGTSSGNGNGTISFSPSKVLNYGTTYTATITNVRDGAGNVLGNVSWSFTTTSTAPSTYHKTPDGTINDVGTYNSIVLGTDNTSYITYYNSTDRSLYVISTIDGTSFSGPYRIAGPSGAEKVGEYSSLAIDPTTGQLHIAYYHEGEGLMYATATIANINSWTLSPVDNSSAIVGKYTSITLDSSGKVYISYYDETNTALKYAIYGSGAWIVDSGLPGENPGLYTSIKVHNGIVHISYYDSVNRNLKYINSSDLAPYVLDSTGNVGEFSSLYVDSSGLPYIIYNHVSAADGKRRIRIITPQASTGIWTHTNISEVSSLTSNPIFVDSNGIMYLSYYSGRVLYYKSGVFDLGDWSKPIAVDDSGIGNGIYTSIVSDSNGKARISYYDATEGDLKFAN